MDNTEQSILSANETGIPVEIQIFWQFQKGFGSILLDKRKFFLFFMFA